MTYKILIKGENSAYAFATDKKEITEPKVVIDVEGNETIEHVPTGKYQTVIFETDDVTILKEKYVSLMDSYKKNQLNAIADVDELVTITVDVEEVEPISNSLEDTPSIDETINNGCNCPSNDITDSDDIGGIFDNSTSENTEVSDNAITE